MVAVLAAAATTCSLVTARAAIRATKAHVPTLAGRNEPLMQVAGGFESTRSGFDGRRLVVTRRWHTRRF